MNLQQLEHEALHLSQHVRAQLAQKLLLSLEDIIIIENEKQWFEEALRRSEELDNDKTMAKPANEVFAKARKIIH